MINIEFPDDLISLSLHNVFKPRVNDRKFIKHAKDWNKKIVLHIEPFYPVTVIFEGENIRFEMREYPEPDLKVRIHVNTMLDIANDRLNPFYAIEEGKMEIDGLGEDSEKIMRFYNIFVVSMQMIAQEPNVNYFELNKDTR
ncbi:MAG: SCP2 sterol-binding domain-containing protein [Candidatus Lokiarchaeota archaeon]|nr:SCP2 sterol-binding domain-containing protein [Candidatus Lokiarchaeota archaeon]